jgi:hypothetical protein
MSPSQENSAASMSSSDENFFVFSMSSSDENFFPGQSPSTTVSWQDTNIPRQPSSAPGSDVTSLSENVHLSGLASLEAGIIRRLSVTHMLVLTKIPPALSEHVWVPAMHCPIGSRKGLYGALPEMVGFLEMVTKDMGGCVLILSEDGDRRGAAVGVAYCMLD